MQWVNEFFQITWPISVSLVLIAVNLLLAYVIYKMFKMLARYRAEWQEAREELGQKQYDREQFYISTQAQITRMQEKMHDLTEKAFVAHFETDELYSLVAKHEGKLRGVDYYYGVVKQDDNIMVPFMVPVAEAGGLEELAAGDQFSLFANRLAGVIPIQDANSPIIQFPAPKKNKRKDYAYEMAEEYYESLPYLKVIAGPDKGAVYYLPFTSCTLGRDKRNPILLSDEKLQEVHAKLVYEDHHFSIMPEHDKASLLLNDQKIANRRLNFGDVVTLGGTRMLFSCKGFDLREENTVQAIALFKTCLEREPNFIIALKNLAFLLERDIRFKRESAPIWKRLSRLERRA